MKFEMRNFDRLLGIPGFSDQMLKTHFELYQGYVKNTNELLEEMKHLQEQGKEKTPSFAELSRRFGWEYNGMRLHELYFGNMNKHSSIPSKDSELLKKLEEDFGSYQTWETNFKAKGMTRGIGWVILCFDTWQGGLFNVWINEHDAGHLAGAIPLLVLDVYEHAYMLDYGIKKEAYLTSFFGAIDWEAINRRFDLAHSKIPIEDQAWLTLGDQ